jgi:hypothetical protein
VPFRFFFSSGCAVKSAMLSLQQFDYGSSAKSENSSPTLTASNACQNQAFSI